MALTTLTKIGKGITSLFKAKGATHARTLEDRLGDLVNVKDYGVVGDGITDDTAAFQRALDASVINKKLITGNCRVRVSESLVIRSGDTNPQSVMKNREVDMSGCIILPDDKEFTVIKISGDFIKLINPTIHGFNGSRKVTAIGLVPETDDVTVLSSQQFNTLVNPSIENAKVGIEFKAGATINGVHSGSYYNTVEKPTMVRVTTGVKFSQPLSGAGGSLTTRTTINNMSHVGGNCSLYMEACETLTCIGGNFENITETSTGGLLSTPTIIHEETSVSFGNHHNLFISCTGEVFTKAIHLTGEWSSAPMSFFGYAPKGKISTSGAEHVGKLTLTETGQVDIRNNAQGSNVTLNLTDSVLGRGLSIYASKTNPEIYSTTGQVVMPNSDLVTRRVRCSEYTTTDSNNAFWLSGNTLKLASRKDAGTKLGDTYDRWSEIFCVNTSINTSDEREKNIQEIPQSWINAAKLIKPIRYQWLSEIDRHEKGDRAQPARWHIGYGAQSVFKALQDSGVENPWEAAFMCRDIKTSQLDDGSVIPIIDESGNQIERWGIRQVELNTLKIAVMK